MIKVFLYQIKLRNSASLALIIRMYHDARSSACNNHCSETRKKKLINTLCGQNVDFFFNLIVYKVTAELFKRLCAVCFGVVSIVHIFITCSKGVNVLIDEGRAEDG